MQTVHAADVSWGKVSGHRSGRIEFKRLLQGTPDTPDNFEWSIVRTGGDYFTPRHRHNFDQVRLCLEGAMNYAPGKDLKAGTVGYFPEGYVLRPAVRHERMCHSAAPDGRLDRLRARTALALRNLARANASTMRRGDLQHVRRFPTASPAAD